MNYSDNSDIIICESCESEFSVAQFGIEEEEINYCPFCGHDLHEEYDEEDEEDEDEEDW
jgi:rRNA maturation endonuclease Nob1